MDLSEVIGRLIDAERWPTYRNAKELPRLEQMAEQAYSADTFEGYLGYVLMAHQACEDYILILLKHAQFTLSISLALQGFSWKQSQTEGRLDRQMFGKLLEQLENSIDFEGKQRLIETCGEMNQIRNRLAHRLVDGVHLRDLTLMAEGYRAKTAELIDLFNEADEGSSWFYTLVIHDAAWDRLIMQQMNGAEGNSDNKRWEDILARLAQERARTPLKGFRPDS